MTSGDTKSVVAYILWVGIAIIGGRVLRLYYIHSLYLSTSNIQCFVFVPHAIFDILQ